MKAHNFPFYFNPMVQEALQLAKMWPLTKDKALIGIIFVVVFISEVVFHLRWSKNHLAAPDVLQTALEPMATLETSPEANSDRQAGRQAGGKATYRGSSYRSAQKFEMN